MYSDFSWDTAPLSSKEAPVVAGAVYLAVVFLLPKVVPTGGFKHLKHILVAHNAFLSAWSLLMFSGCLWEMINRVRAEQSTNWMFCEVPGSFKGSGPLYFWSYMFYVSKYYEMVDTFLAILKGSSPPHFKLHVYHHALVPVVVRSWLEYRQSLQFPGLLFNTFVHVVMYAYYVLKVLRIPTPWKAWITRIQILQFVTSIVLLGVSLTHMQGDFFGDACAGTVSLWINAAFNVTLLQQFVGVLFSPPRKEATEKKST